MFRLLDVPHVVFRNILNQLTPSEMIAFALCSRRAQQFFKTLRFKSIKWELWICTRNNISWIAVQLNGMKPLYCIMNIAPYSLVESAKRQEFPEIDECFRQCLVGNNRLISFWNDINLGFKKFVKYILDLLDQHNIAMVSFSPESLWLFDWLNEMNLTYASTQGEESLDEKQYEYVLRHCNPSDALFMISVAPENFRYDGPFRKLSMLHIESGLWVTIDNLMAMDSITIYITTSSLTSLDFNRYLKNWLISDSRLKCLMVNMTTTEDPQEVLVGLEDKLEFVEKKRDYMWQGKFLYPRNCYDLARHDGVVASFKMNLIANGGSQFLMYVWPDFDGRKHLEVMG